MLKVIVKQKELADKKKAPAKTETGAFFFYFRILFFVWLSR